MLCVIAQIFIDRTSVTPARILVTYVTSGVFLTGLGLYEPLKELAGAGATVPLTGFGYSLAKGVEKAVDERGVIGAFTGGLTATAGGIAAALCFGFLAALLFRSRQKP
ncbi:MAG: SpoVA/SpoVAEb family sporulation membrane protein [Ruminococcaceae bacterium]|nr:SpoVA/SpoVAEb family sporulation membrane protein [Oscillospiraceae bacterium]